MQINPISMKTIKAVRASTEAEPTQVNIQ